MYVKHQPVRQGQTTIPGTTCPTPALRLIIMIIVTASRTKRILGGGLGQFLLGNVPLASRAPAPFNSLFCDQ